MTITFARVPEGTPILEGTYRIGRRLAAGEYDEVYAAQSAGGARCVIWVVWRDGVGMDDAAWDRARAALLTARTVTHALDQLGSTTHVLRTYDAIERPGALYLVMEPADYSLADAILLHVVHRGMSVPSANVERWIRDAARGLKALHDAGWAHGALTPSSVLVLDNGSRAAIGTLTNARPLATQPGAVVGDPARTAEAMERVRDDIRALGMVAYALLTGKTELPANVGAELAAVRPDAPAHFVATVLRMLGLPPGPAPHGGLPMGTVPAATYDAALPLQTADAVLAALRSPSEGVATDASAGAATLPTAVPGSTAASSPTRHPPVPLAPAAPTPRFDTRPHEAIGGRSRLPAATVWLVGIAAGLLALGVVSVGVWVFQSGRGREMGDATPVISSTAVMGSGSEDTPTPPGVQIQVALPLGGVPVIGDVDTPPNPFDQSAGELAYQATEVDIDPRVSAPVDVAAATNLAAMEAVYDLRLTPAERAFLAKNRFVMKRLVDTGLRPSDTYDLSQKEFESLYRQVKGSWDPRGRKPENSVFLTSDLYLHTYHLLYVELVKEIEIKNYFPALNRITERLMLAAEKRMAASPAEGAERTKWSTVRNYFAVPHCLLETAVEPLTIDDYQDKDGSFQDPEAILAEFQAKDASADTAANVIACARSLGLDATSEGLVTRDIERIFEARAGFGTPAIFADEYDSLAAETGVRFGADFSLFLPRGTYTGTSQRRQYLRAMTWFNQVPFFVRSPELTGYAFAVAELLAADPDAMHDYVQMEQSMTFLVGGSDDLLPLDYVDASAISARSENPAQAAADFLAKEADPAIKGLAAHYATDGDVSTLQAIALTKGMRFFPQRFTLDNYWLARLTQGDEPPHPGYTQKLPPMGSSLQVMGSLGSQYAREQLFNLEFYTKDTQTAVDQAMGELTAETASYADEDWQDSAYSLWLWTLRSLFLWRYDHIERLPPFVQSPYWDAKTLQTASGSWTELRHAAVLNAKQNFAERGAGGICDPRPIPEAPKGYVEPPLEMLDRLRFLAAKTHAGLTELGYTDLTNLPNLVTFVDVVDLSREYVARQLRYEQMQERTDTIESEDSSVEGGVCIEHVIDGTSDWEVLRRDIVDKLESALPVPIEGPILSAKDQRATVIADLFVGGDATYPTRVLYEGTGVPNVIVAVVNDANGPRAVIGFTYSHYELMPKNVGQSITDEIWQRRFYQDSDEGDPFLYTDRSRWPDPNLWYRALFAEP